MSRRLSEDRFERLCEQLGAAAAFCSDDQLLDLADHLHTLIRRRRAAGRRAEEPRTFAEPRVLHS